MNTIATAFVVQTIVNAIMILFAGIHVPLSQTGTINSTDCFQYSARQHDDVRLHVLGMLLHYTVYGMMLHYTLTG